MSALPAPPIPPLEEEPPRQPRRRALWKRVLGWLGVAIGIVIVLVIAAVVLLVHTSSGHQYILRTAQEKATAALGVQVKARDFDLSWSGISPKLDLYDVVVHGADPYPDPPLIQADHVGVAVTVTSLLRRTWYLKDVTVNHPVVHVFVDPHGTDNLPQTKSNNQKKSNTNVFDLGVRHALLDRGEVYYNNQKSALDADVHELTFRSGFDPAERKYTGTLSYRNGHVKLETFRPIPHDFDANFWVTETEFHLERASMRSGASTFVVTAKLQDFAQPKVEATYDATVDTGEMRYIMRNPSLPVGVLRASGTVEYVSVPDTPLMEMLRMNGSLSSRSLAVKTSSLTAEVRDIGAQYSLAKGNVLVRNIRASLLGGQLTGTMTMKDITGASRSTLNANLRGVSLAAVKPMIHSPALEKVSLAGGLDASANATWGKTFNDLVANADATLNARMTTPDSSNAFPVDAVIHAKYSAPRKEITLARSYLRTPKTAIDLNGTVSNRSALQVRMRSNDLHEVEVLADMFREPQPGQQPLGLYGTASFEGAVSGSTDSPRITGLFNAADLRVKGSSWRVVRTNVDLSPSSASLQNGVLQPADRGRIRFALRTALEHWSPTKTTPFQASLNASDVNVSDLTRLAGSDAPVTGTVNANVALSGTQLNPVGHGNVNLTQAKVSEQPIQSAKVDFRGTGNELHADLNVRVPGAGTATGVVTYLPKTQGYDARLQATGIDLSQLQAIKERDLDLKGVLNLTAEGKGTLQAPNLEANLQIPQLSIHGQTVSGVRLQADVANHVASYNLDSEVVNTSVKSHGTVQLSGDYYAEAVFDTQSIPLAPLVAAFAPSQAGNISGQTELHGTLRGPLKKKELVEAHVTIPQLAMNYQNKVQLAQGSPIHLDYANGVLNVPRATIRGTGTDLQFQGTVPIVDRSAPVSLLLLGTVDLAVAQIMNPDIASTGQLKFDINSYGARSDPNIDGQIRVVNAGFASGDIPVGLQNGSGVLTLTKNRLDITQFTGSVGGGTVRATGGVVYRPEIRFDVALAANGIRLLYPEGVRSGVDAEVALSGTTEDALLRGHVRIDQLSFTRDFDLMNFTKQFGGGATTPPPAQGFSNSLKLDIAVSSSGMNVASRELSLQGAANLRVSGTAAQPVILGRVNLSGGDLIFMGNRYVLQGGTIDFVNASQTQPVVNIGVNTTIEQYNIQMRFWGPADHLHTNYASDPALPPADIINLIAFGKTSEASAANPTPPGALGAQSLVASQVSSQVTSRISKIAGISQLSIDPVLGGNGQNPGARIAIQQRVTSKIYVDFATDVTSTQQQVIKFEYHATPRMSFNASRDQNGGFGFDVRLRKTW